MTEHVDNLAKVLTGLDSLTAPSNLADRLNRLAIAYDEMQGELHRQAADITALRDEVQRIANKEA